VSTTTEARPRWRRIIGDDDLGNRLVLVTRGANLPDDEQINNLVRWLRVEVDIRRRLEQCATLPMRWYPNGAPMIATQILYVSPIRVSERRYRFVVVVGHRGMVDREVEVSSAELLSWRRFRSALLQRYELHWFGVQGKHEWNAYVGAFFRNREGEA
jgi:hypothetical protein